MIMLGLAKNCALIVSVAVARRKQRAEDEGKGFVAAVIFILAVLTVVFLVMLILGSYSFPA